MHALDDGGFSILTTGGDPFVATHPLPEGAVPGDIFILEFEYFCPDGLDHFEVFFGPPIRAGASAKSGPLPPAELWRPATVDLKTRSDSGWTGRARQFRVDFGSNSGVKLQIRNLHLRKLKPAEVAENQRTLERKEGKERDATAIRTYLKREFPARIESVRCEGDSMVIEGRLPGEAGAELRLAELEMHEEPWREGPRLKTTRFETGPDGAFRIVLARLEEGRDRLFSRWQLVRTTDQGESILSHARHATELPPPLNSTLAQPQPRKTKRSGRQRLRQGDHWRAGLLPNPLPRPDQRAKRTAVNSPLPPSTPDSPKRP